MAYITKEQSMEFEGDKTLYHYTSIYTLIECISPSMQLRLSPIISASDPMENLSPNPSISSYGYDENIERLEKNIDSSNIAKQVNRYYKNLRQLCLCRNSEIDFEGQFTGVFEPIDHFGFAKPRMWDQYGDKYRGVCIALSRKKLEEQLSPEYKIKDIKYSKNHLFRPNIDTSSVDLNEVKQIGEDGYLQLKYESELKKISQKHNDYRDENECKIIIESENIYVYIDIRKYIQGIFVTNKLNYTYESWLKNLATDFKVPLIQISIRRTGINVYSLYN